MKQEILSNEEAAPGIFRMGVAVWERIQSACPGQFVHIRCSSAFDPLLRRPLSIHGINSKEVKLLYKVIGKGTKLLSEKKAGEKLDIIGPLGHGFHVEPSPELVMIVAGGMGIAPLLFLAQTLRNMKAAAAAPDSIRGHPAQAGDAGNSKAKRFAAGKDIRILVGARTGECILCEEEFKKQGFPVEVTTDDGSCGKKGVVSSLFKEFLKRETPAMVYACGPAALLKEVADTCGNYNLPCQVSLENRMACGVGACLGCAIKTKEKNGSIIYKRVCKDGPVFDANTIVWEGFGV